ncbi:hypothetical protein [Candidatus Methylomirabilis sp.]|uniref:hypothetical protein n=1 Tax=Candidatus Methylomirabilis sp. TaxID=2032687 RepID=UPI003075F8B8
MSGTYFAEVNTRLGELERRVSGHDEAIRSLVTAIRQLMGSPGPPAIKRIGFRVEEAAAAYRRRRRHTSSR